MERKKTMYKNPARRAHHTIDLIMLLLVLSALIILVGQAIGQVKAAFTEPALVMRMMDDKPESAVAAIESVCTQEQLDAIQTALLQNVTPQDKAAALEKAAATLKGAGFKSTDAVVQAVDAEKVEVVDKAIVEEKPVEPVPDSEAQPAKVP